jgi:two-component system sensor histidine kinase HydH
MSRARVGAIGYSARMPEAPAVILLVDDNAALVDNLAEVLTDVGHEAKRAGSCAEARKQAATGFDVALVDLRLPDGDGIALAQALKASAPDAEVILLTGYASTESAASALRAGAFAYLVKPVPPADLLLSVDQALRKVRLTVGSRDLARRAQQAEKLAAVGTMAAGLSHEIKNPLNAATLQLMVLERRLKRMPGATPEIFEPLAIVQEEIKRLASFLDEFLRFARPREIVRAPMDAAQMVAQVVALLEPQAAMAQLRLERRVAALPTMMADEGRLQQALVNLVLNAIQATPAGGWVRVEAAATATELTLAVEDSGAGISEDVLQHIFDPFFTTKHAGTGLGLPLVHSTVSQHRGTIQYERAAGGGARFVIHLPLA